MSRKLGGRVFKTILWVVLFPWVWALPFGIAACGGVLMGVAGPGWYWGWGIGIGIVAAFGTAGILHKPLEDK